MFFFFTSTVYQQCDLLNNNGCKEGEECRYSSEDGALRCVCKAGYIQDQLGNCVCKGLFYVSVFYWPWIWSDGEWTYDCEELWVDEHVYYCEIFKISVWWRGQFSWIVNFSEVHGYVIL